jgi:hemolysin activation/secretion protein
MMRSFLLCIVFCITAGNVMTETVAGPPKTEAQLKLEEKRRQEEKIKEKKEAAAKAKREKVKAKLEEEISKLDLPEDASLRLTIREVQISGNTLISTDKLLKDLPAVYNASDKLLFEAESNYLYDFRVLQDIIAQPGQPREVSTRTIQGFTQYLLSVYQDKNYGGIYVYVPSEALKEGRKLQDDILPVKVLEAPVSEVTTTYYNPENEKVEKGYLRASAVEAWSPIQVGDVANRKELDDFVNLLNLNPDRYISAVVSKGIEPNSLAIGYNIYEANPWHWFIQVDNSGTKDREWNPRIGVINTNLLGIDDTFVAIYQDQIDTELDENYSLFGSYDFPLLGPRLRLNLYSGYSEFDISPETGPIDFLGSGTFYGGTLRYNVLQTDGWFFDVKGTLEHTRSKVTPTLFPQWLGTDIKFWLWGAGVDLHRSDDMSNSSLTFDRYESLGGESTGDEFALARTNAESRFAIYTAAAAHSQYLDPNKVHRISGSFRWTGADERLVPAKMTAFGGMYTVRGYDEYEYVADGGILASVQYEFDLVKYGESMQTPEEKKIESEVAKPFVRKLAPLVFFDYGRADIKNALTTEKEHEELMSVGVGTILELGDNFSGAIYYGYPLEATESTRQGKGRLNVGLMLRW